MKGCDSTADAFALIRVLILRLWGPLALRQGPPPFFRSNAGILVDWPDLCHVGGSSRHWQGVILVTFGKGTCWDNGALDRQ